MCFMCLPSVHSKDATTIGKMTFSIKSLCLTLRTNDTQSKNTLYRVVLCLMSGLLSVIMINVIMVSVAMLRVVMLNIVMLCNYAECHYAECHHTECRYAACQYAKCHFA
jgi:hypothetical protein